MTKQAEQNAKMWEMITKTAKRGFPGGLLNSTLFTLRSIWLQLAEEIEAAESSELIAEYERKMEAVYNGAVELFEMWEDRDD